eukprot:2155623-Ditylum_brightwellii.AAC.1
MGNKCNETKNVLLFVVSIILCNIMVSATEVEPGALFVNAKEAAALCTTLAGLGYQQPPMPIQVDNSTMHRIINRNIRQHKSKKIDMCFYWVKDRMQQGQFVIFWKPGKNNKADYFSKHHLPAHHRRRHSE